MKRRCDVACHLGNDDRFHEIKLQSIKNERLQQIEAAERFEQQNKKNKKGLKWLILLIEEMKHLLIKKIKFDWFCWRVLC